MEAKELSVPHRVLHLYNPAVLQETARVIAEREEAEASNPYLYQRYLSLHAEHIISEVTRRESGNSTEVDAPAAA